MTLHTDIPTRSELRSLLEAREPASVSIYLPTSVLPQDARGDRIELKTLTSQAVDELEEEVGRREAAGVREGLDHLHDDDEFWEEQAHSLAVFVSPDLVVDTVFVDIDRKVPGHVDEETGAVTFAEDDAASYGVIDEIARRALLSGGRVLAVRAEDIPQNGAVAAIFRYAL